MTVGLDTARTQTFNSMFDLARGCFSTGKSVHKSGANFDVDVSTDPETIWTGGGLYPWSALTSAQTLYCKSADAGDTGTLFVNGLDSDYKEISESITLTGTTAVTTTKQYLRVSRLAYSNGSGGNAGAITAHTVSGTGTVVGHIDAGKGQSLSAIYTVPAGHTAYMMAGDFSVQKNKGAQVHMMVRLHGSSFRINHIGEVYESTYRYDFPVPLAIPQKSDIDILVAEVETNNTRVTSNFTMVLLEDNP